METRTIPELLQVLLDNEEYFNSGLCLMVIDLRSFNIISNPEYLALTFFFNRNLPPRIYRHTIIAQWSWPYGKWPPRKEWLEQQIEYSKNFEL